MLFLDPIDGVWSEWSAWSDCSDSCAGTQTRQRECNNPPPANNGTDCQGASTEEQECNTVGCK